MHQRNRNLRCEFCKQDTGRRIFICGPGSESIICVECERANTARCDPCKRVWFDNYIRRIGINGLCPICLDE